MYPPQPPMPSYQMRPQQPAVRYPPQPAAQPQQAFQLPRASKGIKIVNPDTGEEMRLPNVPKPEVAPSPVPSAASAATSDEQPSAPSPAPSAQSARAVSPLPPRESKAVRIVRPEDAERERKEAEAKAAADKAAEEAKAPAPEAEVAVLPPAEKEKPAPAEKEEAAPAPVQEQAVQEEAPVKPSDAVVGSAEESAVEAAPEAEAEDSVLVEKDAEPAPEEQAPAEVKAEEPAAKEPAVEEPAAEEPAAEVAPTERVAAEVEAKEQVGEEPVRAEAEQPIKAEPEQPAAEKEAPAAAAEEEPAPVPAKEPAAVEAPEKEVAEEAKLEDGEIADEAKADDSAEEKPADGAAAAAAAPKAPRNFVKIESFDLVLYPDGVKAPVRVDGVIKYERSFLLRFKDAREKWDRPEGLPTNDVIYDDSGSSRGGGSSTMGRRVGTTGLPSRPSARPDMSNPLVRAGSGGLGTALKTSEERYAAARAAQASGSNFLSSFAPKPNAFGSGLGPRLPSSGGLASGLGPRAQSQGGRAAAGGDRRSGRGGDKGGGRQGSQGGRSRKDMEMEAQFTIPIDQIKPLESSDSAWAPPTVKRVGVDDAEEKIRRKLQGLLNKLSLEKFESISQQIMGLGIDNESILALIIAGIFDKAVDEPNFGSMYARLCSKLSIELPRGRPWMADERDPTKNNLFRRLLLTKCQAEFEKGARWADIGKDREHKEISEMTLEEKQKLVEDEERRQKLKRQGLGNIRFIGELFNLGMLGEKIMHACINQLLQDGAKNHGEEELESVCKLMTTIGEKLDHPKAKTHMDEYFKFIKKLATNQHLSSRIRFALQDVVDLREKNHWKARTAQAGPKTLNEIRQDAEQELEEQAQNLRALGRAGSGRGAFDKQGGGRGREPVGKAAREAAAQAAMRGAQARHTGDLSNFGKVTDSMASKRPGDVRLGPGGSLSSFGAGARGWNRPDDEKSPLPMSRQPSAGSQVASPMQTTTSNMFSALADTAEPRKKEEEAEAQLPPSKAPAAAPAGKTPKGDIMSVEQAEKLGESAIKEFFGPESSIDELVRSWEEFSGPSNHQCDDDILDRWFSRAFDINFSKEDDPRVARFGKALARMVTDKVMSSETLEKCLSRQAEMLEDLVPDAPKVFSIFGVIVARLILHQGIQPALLADLCQPLVDSPSRVPQAPKLLKPVFDEILRVEPESAAAMWDESELELKSFWPGTTGTDEVINEWIASNGFEPIFKGAPPPDAEDGEDVPDEEGSPAVEDDRPSPEEAEAGLKELFGEAQTDPNVLDPERVRVLFECLSAEQLGSEAWIGQLVPAVVRLAAAQTGQALAEPESPTREHYSRQREIVGSFQDVLAAILPAEQPQLRGQALSSIQSVCQDLGYPSQFMAHMFRIFHELDIVDDATYEQWLNDTSREEELRQRAQAEVGSFVESLRS
ncbi:hypothetical protein DFJ74DRAFT_674672 [Hyaloraphidium curvatum]|nr:hypothetical protein DFJ74DRAFT_674672 [Hyaloraphidium curvatum]